MGLGSPAYGNSFLINLANKFPGRFQPRWGYAQGPYNVNHSIVTLGGHVQGENATTFVWFNATSLTNMWGLISSGISV